MPGITFINSLAQIEVQLNCVVCIVSIQPLQTSTNRGSNCDMWCVCVCACACACACACVCVCVCLCNISYRLITNLNEQKLKLNSLHKVICT